MLRLEWVVPGLVTARRAEVAEAAEVAAAPLVEAAGLRWDRGAEAAVVVGARPQRVAAVVRPPEQPKLEHLGLLILLCQRPAFADQLAFHSFGFKMALILVTFQPSLTNAALNH
mmetsp:Transcript_24229/g.64892  ORF Transcript_24229/g.64892 Transcript_24229/m.64892 type:complete len:114 (+) Transcript_24229:995-1336(+)